MDTTVTDTALERSAQLDEEIQQKAQMVTQSLGNILNAEDFAVDVRIPDDDKPS